MSRVELASLGPGVLLDPSGRPIDGVRGAIYLHKTTTPVTIWSDEVGGIADVEGTFTTDIFGRIPGWVDISNNAIDVVVPPADAVTVNLTPPAPGVQSNLGTPGFDVVPGLTGIPTLVVTSNFGISRSTGIPYYNTSGAAVGEGATLQINTLTGWPMLVLISGQQ